MAVALALPQAIPALGWFRIVIRLFLMIALLAACIPLFYVFRLTGRRNPVPRFFLGGVAWITGVEIKVTGTRPRRGAFLLANHVSWIDVPALAGVTGAAFVGHDGLASMPVLRWLCTMNDTVFVARYDRTSVAEQIGQVRAAIKDSGALVIFPEGTTSDGTGLLPFKSSLLSALDPVPPGIAVQPVLLDYGDEAAEVSWIGEEHGLDNFKRILARGRPVRLTLRFLPPLSGHALADRKTIAAAARDAMLRELQN